MANVYRKFNDAVEKLEAHGNSFATFNQASAIVDAHKALMAVVEREQRERRKLRIFARVPKSGNVSSMSDWVLDAHYGWCARVIKTAGEVGNSDNFTQVTDVMQSVLVNARDQIIQNKHRFRDPKDGLFNRIYDFLRRKAKGLWPKLHRIRKNPYTADSEAYLSLREQHDKETAALKAKLLNEIVDPLPLFGAPQTPSTAKLVNELEAALSGVEVNPTKEAVSEMVAVVAEKATHLADPDIRLHKVC